VGTMGSPTLFQRSQVRSLPRPFAVLSQLLAVRGRGRPMLLRTRMRELSSAYLEASLEGLGQARRTGVVRSEERRARGARSSPQLLVGAPAGLRLDQEDGASARTYKR